MKSRVVALVLAIVLAVVGGGLVLLYARTADERAVANTRAVTVLVATQRIPSGTTGAQLRSGGYVEAVHMPAGSVPADALGKLSSTLDNLAVTADLQPRQLLLRGMFGTVPAMTGGLPVPDGKMAVTVSLTVPADVAGFVRPGSKIAIFDTYTMVPGQPSMPSGGGLTKNKEDVQHTRILLPQVDVLAVGEYGTGAVAPGASAGAAPAGDTSTQQRPAGGNTNAITLTVAVTQAQAEKLVHGAQTGALYLALLSSTAAPTAGPGVDNGSLFR